MKNSENPVLSESSKYNSRYENEYVKFAKLKFVGDAEETCFENINFGTNLKNPKWKNENGEVYLGIIDANPTANLASFSRTKISIDSTDWKKVSDLAEA